MSRFERIEIALILLVSPNIWWITTPLPAKISVGNLLLLFSICLLAQGLIRDVCLLWSARKTMPNQSKQSAQCMCIESTIGLIGVFIGLLLLFMATRATINMSPILWGISIPLVLISGFFIKDYVVEWNPWRLRKEKDHMNIVFSWKKP